MSLPPCTTAALPPTRAPGMSAMPTHRFCPLSYRSAERRRPLPSTPPAMTTLPPTTPAAALYRVSGRSATAVSLQLPLPISYATAERAGHDHATGAALARGGSGVPALGHVGEG